MLFACSRPHMMPPAMSRGFSARQRRLRHGVPIVIVAILAFVVGLRAGSSGHRTDRRIGQTFARAWARGDVQTMYDQLDTGSQDATTLSAFTALYRADVGKATLTSATAGHASGPHHGLITVPVTATTRAFGPFRAALYVPVHDGKVAFRPQAMFPGLRNPGEHLTRRVSLPGRAGILARDGEVLARARGRGSPIPDVAGEIVGEIGPPPIAERPRLEAKGYPPNARVGLTGLERALETQLAGRPGGQLLAGARVLAARAPRGNPAVRTSIDPKLERAAITALAGRYGGAAAIDPRTGEILALAGVAYSALQPPGSTFKIVTAAGALGARIVSTKDSFPIESAAILEGTKLSNANGESCGGTFTQAFANSCNSVFAPLGAKLGAKRLVATAERLGFNHPSPIAGASESTIPAADAIGDDLAVGSSAIGQGKVQATALQMTLVAATVAAGGRRPLPTLLYHPRPRFVPALSPRVVGVLRRLMIAVVAYGTGTAAAIPGVQVAGKTGTAELQDTAQPATATTTTGTTPAPPPKQTDAWFVAFAPARHARIAAGMLLVEAGAGGAVAAPAVHGILTAGLTRR